ncbi:hypothetical protein AHAS_Ahas02G0128700 [Arachis hypogaea]
MVQKEVGMVGKDHGHMEVFGENRLVSAVEVHVEDMTYRHLVVVLKSHKEVHHSHWIDMHHRMSLLHSALVGVVAKRVDHMHMAPPTFDYPILDACLHCSSHFLQHSCNHTQS